MASFKNCSFSNKHSNSGRFKCKTDKPEKKCMYDSEESESDCNPTQKHRDRSHSAERGTRQMSMNKSKKAAAADKCEEGRQLSMDKRSKEFENEFAKNKAKEFKDAHSKNKTEQNKFYRADKAKKLRRNHVDNQRARKNQEYCLIEEKKYIKKRFLKDDSSEAMEDMDKDFAADCETGKEERHRSESCERMADEKESSYCENAKQVKSQTAQKSKYNNSKRAGKKCKDTETCMAEEYEQCSESSSSESEQEQCSKPKKSNPKYQC